MATRTPEAIEAFCLNAQDHWNRQGGRRSQVREVLTRIIGAQQLPFSAEQLLAEARREDRGISQASVYRTLAGLVEAGLLNAFTGPGQLRCYSVVDAGRGGVSNIVCTDCEQIVPMQDDCLPLREGFLARQLGFTPSKMSLRIEASCEELKRTGACARRRTGER
ncbi:MAG: transcriptional repressor [Verrucomicrobiota bacterium]